MPSLSCPSRNAASLGLLYGSVYGQKQSVERKTSTLLTGEGSHNLEHNYARKQEVLIA